ncbi:MAG: PBP1A family penicillin-binding protein [Chroococcales cyanobacterium]
MTNKPPQQPQTQISQIFTQAVQTIQAKVNIEAIGLKPGAKVPELWVQDANASKADVYPLIGDRYLLGRSSKSDIVVRNPVVSQIHFSVTRDSNNRHKMILKDENSTNGIYIGQRRVSSFPLRHGDVFTLGPPELAQAVRIQYHYPPSPILKGLRYGLYGTGGVMALLAVWLGVEWTKYPVSPLPDAVGNPIVVYSRDQQPLQPLPNQSHQEIDQLSEFSPYLPDAVIASEDSRYYWHLGVDPYGIVRAVVINLRAQGLSQGASTITQQLARSLFTQVGRENTASRKLREMVVALKLEAFYSKDEILRNYLNRVYLGVGLTGFEDAAQFYFDQSARELDISEAATLVAILPAPNRYNPVQDYDTALQLRNRVINRMAQLGMISEEEAARARRSRIEVSPNARRVLSSTIAPYFYSYVFQELNDLLGEDLAKEGNFIVETGLDISMQRQAETALRNQINTRGSSVGYSQGAIVTLESDNGVIRALTGGVDYGQSQFNRATQAQRQPGSTFKVFAYAAALEQGISPGKQYSCAPLTWRGQQYRGCERTGGGSTDMYRGLAQSENAIALRIAQDVGLDRVVEMAKDLGVKSKLDAVPGLVLGQSEVNVLEMTGAYAVFANNGVWNRPHAITRILDSSDCTNPNDPQTCRVIYDFNENDAQANQQVISSGVANTMNTLLRGVVQGGTGSGAAIPGVTAAGKTGTTNRAVDLWFIGYVPSRELVTGIWLGNDDNSPTRGSSGQAAQLWQNYMSQVVQ